MPRAFTEEEKIEIKEKIMEIALEIFHDKGTKALSIQELTKRAGIAQGSFYNFWKDKETLIVDLMQYRSMQKLGMVEIQLSQSLADPIEFLTEIIYSYSIDLMIKIKNKSIYQDAFKIFINKKDEDVNHIKGLYIDFLKKIIQYWVENGAIQSADEKGLSNAFIGSFVLCTNSYQFDQDYFQKVLRIYIYNIVKEYIQK